MGFWDNVDEVLEIKGNNREKVASSYIAGKNTENKKNEIKSKEIKEKDKQASSESELNADVVLMTAVEDEYIAVRKIFRNVYAEKFENGFKYSLVNCEIVEGKNITIAIFRQNCMGLVSASMTATYAVNKFNPELLIMCGVCAGVKGKANMGDLVVFSPVYDYGSGKYNSGQFLPDYRQRQIDATVRPLVEKMSCDKNLKREIKDAWENQVGRPQTELDIHIYPGGSGATVITDEEVIKKIKMHQRTLGAIDMESYAIAEVANAATTKEIPWLVVKGIQDFATPLKNDEYREFAAYVSGVFVKKFLERFYLKKEKGV